MRARVNVRMSEEKHFNFERRAGGAIGFLTSFSLHVMVLIALACSAFQNELHFHRTLLSAELNQTDIGGVELSEPLSLDVEPDSSTAALLSDEQVTADPELDLAATLTSQFARSLDEALLPGQSTGIGGETGSGKSANSNPLETKGAAFFGSYASGNRFVYVVDSSRSMLDEDRWKYACNALMDSLNGLRPDQEFFVVCFDAETTLLFNTPLGKAAFIKPNDNVLQRVKRWMRGRGSKLGQATMPAEALTVALRLNPDAIFLLSDGEIQDNSIQMLREVNGFSSQYRQIPIHTIHLFSAQGKQTLQLLARENGGSFTPVER